MKKLAVLAGIVVVCAGLCAALYLMFVGPRMISQPRVRAYGARLPPPPSGSVPVFSFPSPEQTAAMDNPIPPTPENLNAGSVYYRYYCAFCHGADGNGTGPVGQSYIPVPADLRSDKVQSYTDGQLLMAMFKGPGHEPVESYTVLPEHRWYLVLYVRQLGKQQKAP